MGNQNYFHQLCKEAGLKIFNSEEWRLAQTTNIQLPLAELASQKISFLHKSQGIRVDGYPLSFRTETDLFEYLSVLKWRNQCPSFVRCFFIDPTQTTNLCSTNQQIWIYFQYIAARLTDITDFPFPQNLFVLKECFEAYKHIYKHYQYFNVKEAQVCFTDDGKVKVWVNENLQKNQPHNYQISAWTKKPISEAQIIRQIIGMVRENTEKRFQSMDFGLYLQRQKGNSRMSFDQAILILQKYATDYRIVIPNKIYSLVSLFKQKNTMHFSSPKIKNPPSLSLKKPKPNLYQENLHRFPLYKIHSFNQNPYAHHHSSQQRFDASNQQNLIRKEIKIIKNELSDEFFANKCLKYPVEVDLIPIWQKRKPKVASSIRYFWIGEKQSEIDEEIAADLNRMFH